MKKVEEPQGSVLGLLLFQIHINYLQKNNTLSVLNFADDITLYKTSQKTHTSMIVEVLMQN